MESVDGRPGLELTIANGVDRAEPAGRDSSVEVS